MCCRIHAAFRLPKYPLTARLRCWDSRSTLAATSQSHTQLDVPQTQRTPDTRSFPCAFSCATRFHAWANFPLLSTITAFGYVPDVPSGWLFPGSTNPSAAILKYLMPFVTSTYSVSKFVLRHRVYFFFIYPRFVSDVRLSIEEKFRMYNSGAFDGCIVHGSSGEFHFFVTNKFLIVAARLLTALFHVGKKHNSATLLDSIKFSSGSAMSPLILLEPLPYSIFVKVS